MSIHPLHPQGAPLTWADLLKKAADEHDVVAAARDFLATVTPQEVALMPRALRPDRIVDANDVTTYAFELTRADCDEESAAHVIVHRLASFFSAASIRLSEIMAGHHRGAEPRGEQRSA